MNNRSTRELQNLASLLVTKIESGARGWVAQNSLPVGHSLQTNGLGNIYWASNSIDEFLASTEDDGFVYDPNITVWSPSRIGGVK